MLGARKKGVRLTLLVPDVKGTLAKLTTAIAQQAGIPQERVLAEVLPEAAWQRCYVHFLRNALDYLPRKADDEQPGSLPRASISSATRVRGVGSRAGITSVSHGTPSPSM